MQVICGVFRLCNEKWRVCSSTFGFLLIKHSRRLVSLPLRPTTNCIAATSNQGICLSTYSPERIVLITPFGLHSLFYDKILGIRFKYKFLHNALLTVKRLRRWSVPSAFFFTISGELLSYTRTGIIFAVCLCMICSYLFLRSELSLKRYYKCCTYAMLSFVHIICFFFYHLDRMFSGLSILSFLREQTIAAYCSGHKRFEERSASSFFFQHR